MFQSSNASKQASLLYLVLFLSRAVSTNVTSSSECNSPCMHQSQLSSVQCNSSGSCALHHCVLPMEQWAINGLLGSQCAPSFVPYPPEATECQSGCTLNEEDATQYCNGKEKYCVVDQCSSWLTFLGIPFPNQPGWLCRRRFANEFPARPLVINGGDKVVEKREKDGKIIVVDVEVNDNGIVDSNALKDEATLECSVNGDKRIVKIKLKAGTKFDLLASIKVGAFFIVPIKQFPSCVEVLLRDKKIKSIDAYIFVEKMEGSETEVVVTGKPATLFALYKTASISFEKPSAFAIQTGNGSLPHSVRIGEAIDQTQSNGLVSNTVNGFVKDSTSFGIFSAKWRGGSFTFIFNYIVDLNVDLSISSKLLNGNVNEDLSHFVLTKGIKNCEENDCDFFDGVESADFGFLLPEIDLRIVLGSKYTGTVDDLTSVNHKARIVTSWPPINVRITVKGEYGNLGASLRDADVVIEIEQHGTSVAKTDSSFNNNVVPNTKAETDAQIKHMLNIVIEISTPLHGANMSMEISTDGNVKGKKTDDAFPSYTGPAEKEGVCSTCHAIQFDDKSTQRNTTLDVYSVEAAAVENDEIVITPDFSKNVTVSEFPAFENRPHKVTCLVPQFQNGIPCDGKCCNLDEGQTCRTKLGSTKRGCADNDPLQAHCWAHDDPHIGTFDNARYDCQTQGEYVFIKSDTNDLAIHSRFRQAGKIASVDGVAVKYKDTIVEISEKLETAPVLNFGSWPVVILINKESWNMNPASLPEGYEIESKGRYVVLTIDKKIVVSLSTWHLKVELAKSLIVDEENYLGLCGTPNGNATDDFMDKAGNPTQKPVARNPDWWTKYCFDNWKITSETDSLFLWSFITTRMVKNIEAPFLGREDSNEFKSFNLIPANTEPPSIGNAPQALKDKCGVDEDCLLDGVVEGDAAAQRLLQHEQTAAEERAQLRGSTLFVTPSSFQAADLPKLVTVKVDLRETDHDIPSNLESFSLFLLDPITRNRGKKLVDMVDDGSTTSADEKAGDMLFSGKVAITSNTGGEKFSFEAIPVIGGVLEEDSALRTSQWDALTSFSDSSGLGEKEETSKGKDVVDLSGTELVMSLTWSDNHEVEFRAMFWRDSLTKSPRCSRRAPKYLSSGGSTSTSLSVVVATGKADDDGVTKRGFVLISMAADIVTTRPSGAKTGAILSVFLRDAQTKDEIPDTMTSVAVKLGETTSCARKRVAFIRLLKKNGKINMMIFGA